MGICLNHLETTIGYVPRFLQIGFRPAGSPDIGPRLAGSHCSSQPDTCSTTNDDNIFSR